MLEVLNFCKQSGGKSSELPESPLLNQRKCVFYGQLFHSLLNGNIKPRYKSYFFCEGWIEPKCRLPVTFIIIMFYRNSFNVQRFLSLAIGPLQYPKPGTDIYSVTSV